MMKKLLPLILALVLWFATVPTAEAEGILVRCKDSPAYQERVASYPNNYYFNEPDRAYGEYLTCGEADGLPHLVIGFNRAVDIAIAFSIFFILQVSLVGRVVLIYEQLANKSLKKSQKYLSVYRWQFQL